MNDRQRAVERLGVSFHQCDFCCHRYVWDEDETWSVTTRPDGGDYDDGNSNIVFFCSHLCASRRLATLPGDVGGFIWRDGKCGGTMMPPVEEVEKL
jgi:hypothetical protein